MPDVEILDCVLPKQKKIPQTSNFDLD